LLVLPMVRDLANEQDGSEWMEILLMK